LLARESLLYTFIENYYEKFNSEPTLKDVQKIAYIISWNIWQMDGLKCVVPNSCSSTIKEEKNLFDNSTSKTIECKGCKTNNIHLHNGIYCLIMDWTQADLKISKQGQQIKFVDMIQDKDGK
ncbi:MAG: restriction endonuclease subunit M, partial [Bacteroidota bacterium]|nr:restriction endonuclease subunit M [Bacteroidota bacterium]